MPATEPFIIIGTNHAYQIGVKLSNASGTTKKSGKTGGFSLVENMFATALISLGLTATYTLNAQAMSTLRMANQEASASQVLQQRIEQLRIANWQRVSNPTWIRDNILNVAADGSATLNGLSETITVVPYNSATPYVNTFARNGTTTGAAGTNVSLLNENSVTVKWSLTWKGMPSGKIHKRETLAVLGKGGIAK